MKYTLLLLMLFMGVKGMGQVNLEGIKKDGVWTNDSIKKYGPLKVATTVSTSEFWNITLDTVRVIMMVCDTAGYGHSTVGFFHGRGIWWQFGYRVIRGLTTEEMGSTGAVFISKVEYLDADKRPIPNNIYVWPNMVNEIKESLSGLRIGDPPGTLGTFLISQEYGILNNKDACDGIIFGDGCNRGFNTTSPSYGIAVFGSDTACCINYKTTIKKPGCCANILHTKYLCDKCKKKIKDFEKTIKTQTK